MIKPVSNPPNPWESTYVEWIGEPSEAKLEVFEEEPRSILAENESPDVGFRWSLNPYRGCFHACSYCFARTSHEYLGFGAGTDFDRKIVVKINAPQLLRREISRRSWKGEVIIFSGNTDCYQPLEAVYELTRRCLEVCAEFRNPVAIITKGALVRRDVDLLARMARETSVSVSLSIPFSDDAMSRAIEPNASLPSQRFETLRLLSEAGIGTGVAIAPLIPGLNDGQICAILERARACGARSAFLSLVRLAGQTLPVFRERLEQAFPDRAPKVWNAIRQTRGGKLNESEFGLRMHGVGPRWEAIRSLFDLECRRLGFNQERTGENEGEKSYQRPGQQGALFELEPGLPL